MSSEPIEGEPSHLEAIPIFSPSMPTLDVSFKPILDPNDSSYALFWSLIMILEIHQDTQSIGVMKATRRPRRATTIVGGY